MPDDLVTLRLTSDEALVLFEWLHREEESDWSSVLGADASELVALNALSCLLEAELVEPFDSNYDELVRDARRRLMGGAQ